MSDIRKVFEVTISIVEEAEPDLSKRSSSKVQIKKIYFVDHSIDAIRAGLIDFLNSVIDLQDSSDLDKINLHTIHRYWDMYMRDSWSFNGGYGTTYIYKIKSEFDPDSRNPWDGYYIIVDADQQREDLVSSQYGSKYGRDKS